MAVLRRAVLLAVSLLVLLSLASGVSSTPSVLVISPRQVRFYVPTTIVLSCSGLVDPSNVTISISDPDAAKPILTQNLIFKNAGSQNVTFTLLPQDVTSDTELLNVEVEGPGHWSEDIEIKRDVGFIIIHTDKPVYSPTQTVQYRVLATDEHQRLAPWKVHVDIVSPNGIIVDQLQGLSSQSAFDVRSYRLHKHCIHGVWKIQASFKENIELTTKSEVTFEVKEYILPRFEVKMSISPETIIESTEEIEINLDARYVFGKGIDGKADIKIGIHDGSTLNRLAKSYHAKFISGRAAISINTSDLSVIIEFQFPLRQQSLYVEANVTDGGYGVVLPIRNYSVPISTSFSTYRLEMEDKGRFMLSNPYLLKGRLLNFDERPAVGIQISLKAHDAGRFHLDEEVITDSDGRFSAAVTIPRSDHLTHLEVELSTINGTSPFRYSYIIRQLHTGEILLQEHNTGGWPGISISYIADNHMRKSHLVVMVESRGQQVYMESFPVRGSGMRIIKFPKAVYKEFAPHARVTVLYNRVRNSLSEVVMESLLLDVPDTCLEELSLKYVTRRAVTPRDYTKRPSELVKFRLEGANNTRVGLIAVDKSVHLLAGRKTISRKTMFDYIGNHSFMRGDLQRTARKTWKGNGYIFGILGETTQLKKPEPVPKPDMFYLSNRDAIGLPGIELSGKKDWAGRKRKPKFDRLKIPARDVFPETWFFENRLLASKRRGGKMILKKVLPDTTTTWTIQAVGVSSGRGICVSNPLDFIAFKNFFVDLQLPFKVVRLETVRLRFSVFNYQPVSTRVTVAVRTPEELCLVQSSRNGKKRGRAVKTVTKRVAAQSSFTMEFKLVPLKAGYFNITVGARGRVGAGIRGRKKGGSVTDKVVKTLYVVPEGRPVIKTVTFQLDPSALLAGSQKPSEVNDANTQRGEIIKNTWDVKNNEQTTLVDMALPNDTIHGTSHSSLFAYGDLLGDVVSSVLLESRSLMEGLETGGRRVLGDLSPAVYSLHYLHQMGLLTQKLMDSGRVIVQEGVSQLLTYRNESGGFHLSPGKQESTWFTAAVLQTLCTVNSLKFTFVDERLVQSGVEWLLGRMAATEEDVLLDHEPRYSWLSKADSSVLLASEALLFVSRCRDDKEINENRLMLESRLTGYMENNLDLVTSALTLAKVSLALQLVDSEKSDMAMEMMLRRKKETSEGIYWSDNEEEGSRASTGALYQPPVDAFLVETTSHALMSLLEMRRLSDVRSVVSWLVQQRGQHGAFVGAMDTIAATQALARYSRERQSIEADLQCDITAHLSESFHHTIDFSSEEVVLKKGVQSVPTGEVYKFDSRGSRLGQIKINTKYNVAVGQNDHCPFKFNVTRRPFVSRTHQSDSKNVSPLCNNCDLGCIDSSGSSKQRERRSAAHSAYIICIEICLRPITNRTYHNVRLDTGIISGFEALNVTQHEMSIMTKGRAAEHSYQDGIFSVHLNKVPPGETTCFGLHAKDRSEVEYQQAAVVTVRLEDRREPSCSLPYDVSDSSVTLPVLCSNPTQRRKGECVCTSGTCGKCRPAGKKMNFRGVQKLLCNKDYVYKVKTIENESKGAWYHLTTDVIGIHMPGKEQVVVDQSLLFSTPKYCEGCPDFEPGTQLYVMGRNTERLLDSEGTRYFRYVVDNTMAFINVTTDGAVPHRRATREHVVKSGIKNGCRRKRKRN